MNTWLGVAQHGPPTSYEASRNFSLIDSMMGDSYEGSGRNSYTNSADYEPFETS